MVTGQRRAGGGRTVIGGYGDDGDAVCGPNHCPSPGSTSRNYGPSGRAQSPSTGPGSLSAFFTPSGHPATPPARPADILRPRCALRRAQASGLELSLIVIATLFVLIQTQTTKKGHLNPLPG